MTIDIHNYAFIDGNYFRHAYQDTMRTFFQNAQYSDLDLEKVKRAVSASKVYYYDCVDDDATDAADRAAFLEAVDALDGFHVRRGTITGAKRNRRQKQVDVQLAVDMLTHAFHKNFWHASLIAGDWDFRPLIEALIGLGRHIHVYYEEATGAKRLYRSADVGVPLTIPTLWDWSTDDFQRANRSPHSERFAKPFTAHLAQIARLGMWEGHRVEVQSSHPPVEFSMVVYPGRAKQQMNFRYPDLDRMVEFFEMVYGGKIVWD